MGFDNVLAYFMFEQALSEYGFHACLHPVLYLPP